MTAREILPWVLGAAAVVIAVLVWLWITTPEANPLEFVYSVL